MFFFSIFVCVECWVSESLSLVVAFCFAIIFNLMLFKPSEYLKYGKICFWSLILILSENCN